MRRTTALFAFAFLAASVFGQVPTPAPDPISSIRNHATGILEAAATIGPTPAPKPAEDWVAFPKEPVPVGRFAVFTVAPDLLDVKWVTVARSTVYADPAFHVDSSGVTALVETATPGDYVVQAFATRGGKTVYCVAEFRVLGTLPQPPPVVVDPNVPPVVTPPVDPNTKPTAATYVYEKDDTAPTAALGALIDRINREKKIVASMFEQNTVDGSGETPDQYKVARSEALRVGLPAWVITAGDKVVKSIKDPADVNVMWEAVQ